MPLSLSSLSLCLSAAQLERRREESAQREGKAALQNLQASGAALGRMEQTPENGAGVSAAPEARAAAKYAAPDQKTISRAFTLDPPAFNLARLDAPIAPRWATKIANELLWWAGILACNFCWACCCCRNLQTEVRAILMLTTIETCAAVAYAINLLITALGTEAEVETSVYYIGTMLIVISSMLWVFVLSSIRFIAPPPPPSPSHPSPVPSAPTPAPCSHHRPMWGTRVSGERAQHEQGEGARMVAGRGRTRVAGCTRADLVGVRVGARG